MPSRVAFWLLAFSVAYSSLALISDLWVGESSSVTMLVAYSPGHLVALPLLLVAICTAKYWRIAGTIFLLFVTVLLFATGFTLGTESDRTELRIATFNTHQPRDAAGRDGVVNQLLSSNCEVLCLQETMPHWQEYLRGYQCIQVGQMLIASKFKIETTRVIPIPYNDSARPLLLATISVNGKTITIANVHLLFLDFPRLFSTIGETGKMKLEQAAFIAKQLHDLKTPVILCGDFNAPPTSVVHRILRRGFADAFGERGFGFGFTCGMRRIDHILIGTPLSPTSAETQDRGASDHAMLSAGIVFN